MEEQAITEIAITEITKATSLKILQEARVKYLGKKGLVTQQLKTLGSLPPEERKAKGQAINVVKSKIEAVIAERKETLEQEALNAALAAERIDVTLPGKPHSMGGLHLLTTLTHQLTDIFRSMGYDVSFGPELEDEFHNFDALNTPDHHPARDLQDTFWTTDGRVLRTHTSPMQIRYMETHKPPFKVVVPGKVYRNEAVDTTHEAMFHQLEALVVGEHITMADLKGAITHMAQTLFGKDTKTMLKPSFFPFVEPGAEFSIWWTNPKTGKEEWLELGGCGMVHPNVFKSVGYEGYTGFAFGFGIDRLAMVTYNIPDIRYLYNSDMRVLSQFGKL